MRVYLHEIIDSFEQCLLMSQYFQKMSDAEASLDGKGLMLFINSVHSLQFHPTLITLSPILKITNLQL